MAYSDKVWKDSPDHTTPLSAAGLNDWEARIKAETDALSVLAAGNAARMAANPDLLLFGTITRDTNEAVTSAQVTWPDGATGTFTATTLSTSFPGTVDAYTITHVVGAATLTYTQPAVTRDAGGVVVFRPAITVT